MKAIISKISLDTGRFQIEAQLSPYQFGASSKGRGIQTAIFLAKTFAMDIQSKVIIKLDIRNAFNCISRRACDDGIAVANCTDSTWIRWFEEEVLRI